MFVTNEELFRKLVSVETKLNKLLDNNVFNSIEEVSLTKASKLLHIGTEKLKDLVKHGRIKALKYKDKNNVTNYRFRISDIKAYQQNHEHEVINAEILNLESSEEIARRIFGRRAVI